MKSKPDLSILKENLPLIIPRHNIQNYLGSTISRGYLENLDSTGKGPKKFRLGRHICYLREDLVAWLQERTEAVG